MSLARMARKTCTGCGKWLPMQWGTLDELRARSEGETLHRLDELRGFLGGTAETWWCEECGACRWTSVASVTSR